MFYFTKTFVHNPYANTDIATDYCLHNEEGVLIGFARQLLNNEWIFVDDGLVKSTDRVMARIPAVYGASVSDLTQRLYMMAVLGMFSYQQGRADHPRFKNP